MVTPSLLLALVTVGVPAYAQTSGNNGTHDPSRMMESEGRFYVYSTGGGSKSSADGLAWTSGPAIFGNGGIPSATTSVVSANEGVWAPDVLHFNGQFYLFYSIANTQNACAVGLVTSPTLNPSSPNYKWTDHGLVVSNSGTATYCTIDPAPIVDQDGNLWLAWGSGYTKAATVNTIYVTRLDNTTGLPSSADTATPGHPLEQGHIEASYIHYHSGFYYLFWNSGGCCNGASSTYEIHQARSATITGPYTTNSKIFYQTTGSIHGPGHIGIYDECGASRFTYHYYPDTGGSVLGENELSWGSDGWPVVGAVSTTKLTPCGQNDSGSTGLGGTSGGTGGNPGTGGATVVSTGGVTGSGGAPGAGGAASTATGGSTGSSGGAGGMAATGSGGSTAAGDSGGSPGGCSCEVSASTGMNNAGFGLLIGLFLAAARRLSRRKGHR